ncbi:MAG TPA: hypothetical protein VIH01_11035, partial [Blastococcus sp.]
MPWRRTASTSLPRLVVGCLLVLGIWMLLTVLADAARADEPPDTTGTGSPQEEWVPVEPDDHPAPVAPDVAEPETEPPAVPESAPDPEPPADPAPAPDPEPAPVREPARAPAPDPTPA